MCGILAVIGRTDVTELEKLSARQHHRGSIERGTQVVGNSTLLHERLSIIDLHTGKQPIAGAEGGYLVHNGEIYNHQVLRDTILSDMEFHTHSDSEVIIKLYDKFGEDFLHHLDGVFAFVIVRPDGSYVAGRDPIGVKPLYWGKDKDGHMYFSSEMKCIADQCVEMEAFPPGHVYTSGEGFKRYYTPDWFDASVSTEDLDLSLLRDKFIASVEKRLMTDVPLGLLLSGGLDSSLVAAIAARKMKENGEVPHSFSVGLDQDSPDLIAAREVAEMIGTQHHEITYSLDEGVKVLRDLIQHTESYDVTTTRASIPMYIMSKYIHQQGIKVVLSGEGADEMFGGYLYFHNAPSQDELQKELVRRVRRLSTADCLRADKSTMAFSIEARVPFLDLEFLDYVMKLHPKFKTSSNYDMVEKYILRKAFDDKENPWIPESILWRQKEQFSDGVGYGWIDRLVEYCEEQVTDKQMSEAAQRYPHNTPATKEAYYYRTVFEEYFPEKTSEKTVLRWIPKWQENDDPSGRANQIHTKADMTENVGQ